MTRSYALIKSDYIFQYGRTYTTQTGSYRYGFNTQEKVDEVSGDGNHNTAEFWEYDTRLGRRWNLDPKSQVNISDYAVMGCNPVINMDWLGDYWDPNWKSNFKEGVGDEIEKVGCGLYKNNKVFRKVINRLTNSNKKYNIISEDQETPIGCGGAKGAIEKNRRAQYEINNLFKLGSYKGNQVAVLRVFNGGYKRETVLFEEAFHAAQDDYYSENGIVKKSVIQKEVEAKIAKVMSGAEITNSEGYLTKFKNNYGALYNKYITGETLSNEEKASLKNGVKNVAEGIISVKGYEEKMNNEDYKFLDNPDIDETFKYTKNEAAK